MIEVFIFLAEQLGARYLSKFLDRVDTEILDTLGRAGDSPDPKKVLDYLDTHPESKDKLQTALADYKFQGSILPPASELALPDDRLPVIRAVMDSARELAVHQQRDLVLPGAVNDASSLVFFLENKKSKPFEIKGRALHKGPLVTVHVVPEADAPHSWLEMNNRTREFMQSETGYISLSDVGIETEFLNTSNMLSAIHTTFVWFHSARYSGEMMAIGGYRKVLGLDEDEREYHLMKDPYAGLEKMLNALSDEARGVQISDGEKEKMRSIVSKLEEFTGKPETEKGDGGA